MSAEGWSTRNMQILATSDEGDPMRAQEIMTRSVVTVHASTTIQQAPH